MVTSRDIHLVLDVDGTCVMDLKLGGQVALEIDRLRTAWLSNKPSESARDRIEEILDEGVNVHFSTGNDVGRLKQGIIEPWMNLLAEQQRGSLLGGVSFFCNGSTCHLVVNETGDGLKDDTAYSARFRLSDAVINTVERWFQTLSAPGLRLERRRNPDGLVGQCTIKPFNEDTDRAALAESLSRFLEQNDILGHRVAAAGRTSIDVVKDVDKSTPVAHLIGEDSHRKILSVGDEVYQYNREDSGAFVTGNDFAPSRNRQTLIVAVNNTDRNPIVGIADDRFIHPGTGPAGTNAFLEALIRAVRGDSFPKRDPAWERRLEKFLASQ